MEQHGSHLVADVGEVTSPGKPSVIKLSGVSGAAYGNIWSAERTIIGALS